TFVSGLLPAGLVHDFVRDGVFAGIGAFLTFVPQIFVLFLVIGVLEDSGYLARAAVMLHRPLGWFGLSGRSEEHTSELQSLTNLTLFPFTTLFRSEPSSADCCPPAWCTTSSGTASSPASAPS